MKTNKGSKTTQGERTVSSAGLGKLNMCPQRIKLHLCLTLCTKINLNWLGLRLALPKLLQEKYMGNLYFMTLCTTMILDYHIKSTLSKSRHSQGWQQTKNLLLCESRQKIEEQKIFMNCIPNGGYNPQTEGILQHGCTRCFSRTDTHCTAIGKVALHKQPSGNANPND